MTFCLLTLLSAAHAETSSSRNSSLLRVHQLPLLLEPSHWLICPARSAFSRNSDQGCQSFAQTDLSQLVTQTSIVLRLHLSLDQSIRPTELSLSIHEMQGADELYLNGQRIAHTGRLPPDFSGASYYPRHYLIPYRLLQFNKPNLLEMVVHHPDNYRFLSDLNIELKTQKSLIQQQIWNEIKYFVISGMLLIIVLLKLHYYLRIPGSYETLALSMFCLFSAIAIVLNSRWFLTIGFDANSLLRFKIAFFIFSQLCLSYFLFIALNLKAQSKLRLIMFCYLTLGIITLVWPQIEYLQDLNTLSLYVALVVTLLLPISAIVASRDKEVKPNYYLLAGLATYTSALFIELARDNLFKGLEISFQTALPLGLLVTGMFGAWWATDNYWKFFKGAVNDHLTGTLLKTAFVTRLAEEMQRAERNTHCLLVAILDIDQFKLINQNYGHDIGDKVLVLVANSLTQQLRKFDLISRISDDEFCIAVNLPEKQQNTHAFLHRLHEKLNHIVITLEDQQPLNMQITTGAVIYNSTRHKSPEMLLHDAEHAVTDAKMKQRGAIQWFDTHNPPIEFVV